MNNDNQNYSTPRRAMEFLGVSYSTLRRWASEGRIKYIVRNSGHRLYDISSVIKNEEISSRQKICYCRVSTTKQSPDLDRQIKYCQEQFPNHEIVKDIGSSLNWKRKGLISILDRVFNGDIEEVVVTHKDRLCRFGFELIQYFFEKYKVRLVVLDKETKTQQQEFTEDILSIITVFSNRYYGKRKYRIENKKNKVVPKQRTKIKIQTMDGNC